MTPHTEWLRRVLLTTSLFLTDPALAADDGKVTDFLLDNGMEVVVIPDHR
ncbi:insulinase family protein, partial [Mesorhizobium sp. M4A.F.Ca.ET.090.04.2.1]